MQSRDKISQQQHRSFELRLFTFVKVGCYYWYVLSFSGTGQR